jgi:hypothetical protein
MQIQACNDPQFTFHLPMMSLEDKSYVTFLLRLVVETVGAADAPFAPAWHSIAGVYARNSRDLAPTSTWKPLLKQMAIDACEHALLGVGDERRSVVMSGRFGLHVLRPLTDAERVGLTQVTL